MNDKPKIINLVKLADDDIKTVLMNALKQELQDVIVLGWTKDEDECLYIGMSMTDPGVANWLVQNYLSWLMDQE